MRLMAIADAYVKSFSMTFLVMINVMFFGAVDVCCVPSWSVLVDDD